MKKLNIIFSLLLLSFVISCAGTRNFDNQSITISMVGDCILGDYFGAEGETLNWKFNEINGNYSYFFKNVEPIFAKDDLTLANLEGPLTTATENADKKFAFKGDPKYVNILKAGKVEAVNIANNHTRDYGMEGFYDTVKYLEKAEIYYSGEGYTTIYKVKNKKIGMAGYRGWVRSIKPQIKNDIEKLKKQGADIILFSFHWGEERENYPNDLQKELGKYAIDNGADIVVGHHPHVLQGIQKYKSGYILYSLGNFVYGGAKYLNDNDSIIYQTTFTFDEKGKKHIETNIIPVSITSDSTKNNYQPIILKGKDKERVLDRIKTYSKDL